MSIVDAYDWSLLQEHVLLTQITPQRQHFISFEQAMSNVDKEVNNSQKLANIITLDVNNHVNDIDLTLEKSAKTR